MHTDSKPNIQIDLFGNIPVLDEWWKKLDTRSRIFTIVFVTWIPLVILSAFNGKVIQAPREEAMLWDFAVHMRLLIALPLLLMSSMASRKRLRPVFQQFVHADLLDERDHAEFHRELQETMRLRDSKFAKAILLYIVIMALGFYLYLTYQADFTSWRMVDGKTTLAGWWYNLISQPILFYTLLYFLYRAGLWCRLLFKIAKLRLTLKAYHGDDCGGLGFLGHSLEVFIVPIFAISASVAGGMMNLVLHNELELQGMKFTVTALVISLMLFFVGPLLFFFPAMREAKAKGILEYGILTGKQLTNFKNKWLDQEDPKDANILQDEDFQSIDSNNSVMARAHSMKRVPVSVKDITPLLIAMLLPFLPVLALKIPWSVMFEQISKILM